MASLADKCRIIARMTMQDIMRFELNAKDYSFDVKRSKCRVMRFMDMIIFVLEQELELTCCRACFFRMPTCSLLHLTQDEENYFRAYVSSVEDGDPLHDFLDNAPDEPFLMCKVRVVPFHEIYHFEEGETMTYESHPIYMPLLQLPEPCGPRCLFGNMLEEEFDMTIAVQGSQNNINNDKVVVKGRLEYKILTNEPLCDLLLDVVMNKTGVEDGDSSDILPLGRSGCSYQGKIQLGGKL